MKKIFKYPLQLTDKQDVELPQGAKVLCVQCQGGQIVLYAEVEDPPLIKQERTFYIIGTGHRMPSEIGLIYIGTVQQPSAAGMFVWHVYTMGPRITAVLVKELRDRTLAGMADCKKALEETNGDIEKAAEWLRRKGNCSGRTATPENARFGHHPDPVIDFCHEVEIIEGLHYDMNNKILGAPADADFNARLERAMSFTVGANQQAVAAKNGLRAIALARVPIKWVE